MNVKKFAKQLNGNIKECRVIIKSGLYRQCMRETNNDIIMIS